MRILLISHNVLSNTENMGKTLAGYFKCFSSNEVAQFYIHSQIPVTDYAATYYRVTDKEALFSIIGCDNGAVMKKQFLKNSNGSTRTDTGLLSMIYQYSRRRTPIIYFLRNLIWKIARWNNKKLNDWIDDFKPDCVFFASGDYAFMYAIALDIAKSRNIPLYISCMDDYYIHNKNSNSLLGRLQHNIYMKYVRKSMDYASAIFCICDKMSEDYSELFNKKTITIHTPMSNDKRLVVPKIAKISYLGNLGFNRDKQLIEIGKVLKSMSIKPDHIDVYSTEKRPEILAGLIPMNGIEFHGAVNADEVRRIMSESLAVIHTEAFDDDMRKSVRYSVSTKIADSLASGTCIFAYGPEEIASIEYLKENNAAIVCTDKKALQEMLQILIKNCDYRNAAINNALELAHRNHKMDITPLKIKEILEKQNENL